MVEIVKASPQQLDQAVKHSAPHLRPIMMAVRDGRCAFALIGQDQGQFALPSSKPRIALIADDMDEALGPSAFHRSSIIRLIRESDTVVVVSSAATVELYAAVTSFTATFRRHAVIIETQLGFEQAWLDFINVANPAVRITLCTVKPMGTA